MLGGIGNMFELLRNAKDLQAKAAEWQEQLTQKRFDAQTGGGAVAVTVDGRGSVMNVKIDPAATQDVELLEDLVQSAVRSAVDRAQQAMREELGQLTGGLNIPGLDGLLSGKPG